MKDERFKDIMKALGYPDSHSLLGALKQVANEVAQETSKDLQAQLDAANSHIAELKGRLSSHEKIAVAGIYYTEEELDESIKLWGSRAVSVAKPAIQSNAIRSILNTVHTCETPNGDIAWSSSIIEEIANELETTTKL